MATLKSLIPDADVLLSLATEEMAEIVLRLASEHIQGNMIHFQFLGSQISGAPGADDGYSQNRRRDIELAAAEAWNWLVVQGLLIREPGINGNNGYMVLSRRAKQLLTNGTFKTYARGLAFPKSLPPLLMMSGLILLVEISKQLFSERSEQLRSRYVKSVTFLILT